MAPLFRGWFADYYLAAGTYTAKAADLRGRTIASTELKVIDPDVPLPPGTGYCTASPNPVTLWEVVTVSDSGFAPNSSVGYVMRDPVATGAGWVITDETGSFSRSYYPSWAGTTTFEFAGGGSYAICAFQAI